jgi:hypothetical protein
MEEGVGVAVSGALSSLVSPVSKKSAIALIEYRIFLPKSLCGIGKREVDPNLKTDLMAV